jgi:branched-chain amino acid transport system ATP-binding protein
MILLEGVKKYFGGLKALDINRAELGIHHVEGIIGPNGAGKSTLVKSILNVSGYRVDFGKIVYRGKNLVGKPTWQIAREGIVCSPQAIEEIPSLSVEDNLLLAANLKGERMTDPFFHNLKAAKKENEERVEKVLHMFSLEKKRNFLAGDLSAPEKKLLNTARAILMNPKILFLDEPLAGVRGREREIMQNFIKEAPYPIVLIEHSPDVIWNTCDYVFFMAEGQIRIQGPVNKVRKNREVIRQYLGV